MRIAMPIFENKGKESEIAAVSYTHLTLPTN